LTVVLSIITLLLCNGGENVDSITQYLKDKLDRAQRELQDVSAKRAALTAEEVRLNETIRALEVILKSEGATVSLAPARAPRALLKPVNQFIAEFISGVNGKGTTHKEIAMALTTAGYKTHRNYPYVVVSKLKEEGKVIDKDGRLLWK
jgi:hypothetical protein